MGWAFLPVVYCLNTKGCQSEVAGTCSARFGLLLLLDIVKRVLLNRGDSFRQFDFEIVFFVRHDLDIHQVPRFFADAVAGKLIAGRYANDMRTNDSPVT